MAAAALHSPALHLFAGEVRRATPVRMLGADARLAGNDEPEPAQRAIYAPLRVERITWYSSDDTRHARGDGRLLLDTRDGVREGYMDAWGTWRLADGRLAGEVRGWADMPEGRLL